MPFPQKKHSGYSQLEASLDSKSRPSRRQLMVNYSLVWILVCPFTSYVLVGLESRKLAWMRQKTIPWFNQEILDSVTCCRFTNDTKWIKSNADRLRRPDCCLGVNWRSRSMQVFLRRQRWILGIITVHPVHPVHCVHLCLQASIAEFSKNLTELLIVVTGSNWDTLVTW